jgi:uncharacterized protein YfeS
MSAESKGSERETRRERRRLKEEVRREQKRWKEERGLDMLLMHAVLLEHKEMCRYLIAHDAEVNDMALTKAIEESLESMVQLLIDHGATVTTDMVGSATKVGSSEIMTMLQEQLHKTEA